MQVLSFNDARKLSSKAIRKRIRLEHYYNHTSGLAANKLQANIVILPNEYANDFLNFLKSKQCQDLVRSFKISSFQLFIPISDYNDTSIFS